MLAILVLTSSTTAIAVASNNHHRLPSSSSLSFVRRRQVSPLLLDYDGTICRGCYYFQCRSDHPRDREGNAIMRRRISYHHHHPCRAFGGGSGAASSMNEKEDKNIGTTRRTAHTTNTTNNEIDLLLHKYGYTSHLVTFTNDELQYKPKIAECYINGSWKLCFIVGLRQSSSSFTATITANDDDNDSSHNKNKNNNNNNGKPPLLEVITMNSFGIFDNNNERKVIDIGQITTIWDQEYVDILLSSIISSSSTDTAATTTATAATTIDILINKLEYYYNIATKSLQNDILPIETTLSSIYNGRVAAIRSSSSSLSNGNGKNNNVNNDNNNNNNNYRRNT